MKIYTASSWKNETAVKDLAASLRKWGHEVYCFAELGDGQHVFMWADAVTPDDDGITCLDTDDSRRAFTVDYDHLDWAECCILLNPCGRDAHLEAGYMKGQGKLLYIIGTWPRGEFSNMYHLADGLFRLDDLGLNALREALDI
jgi:hypothetical protein